MSYILLISLKFLQVYKNISQNRAYCTEIHLGINGFHFSVRTWLSNQYVQILVFLFRTESFYALFPESLETDDQDFAYSFGSVSSITDCRCSYNMCQSQHDYLGGGVVDGVHSLARIMTSSAQGTHTLYLKK